MASLPSQPVDVFLSSLSQIQSQRSGPIGRLLHSINVLATHYDPGAQPPRIKVTPRDGFTAYTTVLRSVADGTIVSSLWANPELLNSLGSQLVSICNGNPRVLNGSTFTDYTTTVVLPHPINQDIFHTSQHTIQAPSNAVLNGVTCSVWTETTPTSSGPVTSSYIGFKDNATRAWVVAPKLLYGPATPAHTVLAKVVQDGTYFWAFTNSSATSHIFVGVFDTNGATLGTTT